MADDLGIAPDDIRRFLMDAQSALNCDRVKTSYGKNQSVHWFYTGFQSDGEVMPTIVTIEVRLMGGKPHAFLTEVRSPTPAELAEIGAQEPSSDISFPTEEATAAARSILEQAKNATQALLEQPRRGILAHDGSTINQAYALGPWTISSAEGSASGPFVSEKILCCDRVVAGTDAVDTSRRAGYHLKQLSLLLSVFWTNHFYEIRSEHRWTLDPYNDENGQLQLRNELRQLGYAPELLGEVIPTVESGPTRTIDRLTVRSWATTVSDPFRPPDDATLLYQLFEKAEIETAQRFLEAAKAYHIAQTIWLTTVTGAISYLVVAAESLIEETLPQCSECHQHRGVSKAFRDLFFKELPCLSEDEEQATRLLKEVYAIRSRHFHDAQFLAGELQEWHPTNILMPDAMAYRTTWERLLGLVNGLLVAYLIRKTTGAQWDRALKGFPDWREGQMFSMTMTIGGSNQAQSGENDAKSV